MRALKTSLPRVRPHWVGDGFHVFPLFAQMAFTKSVSPFLMFDYAAPKKFPPTEKKLGVGQHPPRGFETVTIAFEGEVEHADSLGNSGVIKKGDVQWMTAASGIIHEEFHSREFARQGGTFEMAQIWVNLPKKHKMDKPRYQAIESATIPVVPLHASAESCSPTNEPVGEARIIAGSLNGVTGPAVTMTPIEMWDVKLTQTDVVKLPIPEGYCAMVLVRHGGVFLSNEQSKVGEHTLLMFEQDGGAIELHATEPGTQLLLLAGEPIDEPIASQGPFVMNTRDEIVQAFEDYHSGRMR